MTTSAAAVPSPLDRLIGRRQELARLIDLRGTARLITVCGPGGSGKTRLALEYAGQARTAYWVALAPLTDPALLEPAIAVAVGAPELPDGLPADSIAAALTGEQALLVLDNCEHLIDATARLVSTLLARSPDLTILTTSRENLDLPGEAVLRLGPLSLPQCTGTPTADELLRSDAGQLFAERASAAAHGFVLTDDNAPIVADICERLDGLPLSIELAARRVRVLGTTEILRRLNDRFPLLATSRRTGEDRHRDLRTTIAWSYDLLSGDEKALFRKLSVLSGGFGLEAASAIADLDSPATTLDLIEDLEGKSLLVAVRDRPGRFQLLESIRLFAHDQLVAAGELAVTRQRAVSWLAGLADHYARQAFPTMDVLGPLDTECDNLLAALGWEPDKTLLLTAALAACWRERGQFGPGRQLLESALETPGPNEYRSAALAQAAVLATDVGDGDRARDLAAAAVLLDRTADRPGPLVRSVSRLAGACLTAGDIPAAVAHAREAADLARVHGQPFDSAVCLHNLAYIVLHMGGVDEAAELLAECLPICRTRPEPWLRIGALHSAGTLALAQDELDSAEAYFQEALELRTNHVVRKIHSIEGLAIVAARRGHGRRALRLATATAALRQQSGMGTRPGDPWDERVTEAIDDVRADMTRSELRRAYDDGASLNADRLVAYAMSSRPDPAGSTPLTKRENEILQRVADGFVSRQIAIDLDIAERTVEAHLDNVRDKLGLRTRTQLAAWWARRHRPPENS